MRHSTKSLWRLLLCTAVAAGTLLQAGGAAAQCVASSRPSDVMPASWFAKFNKKVLTLNVFQDSKKLVVGGESGFGIFTLSNGGNPMPLQYLDLVPTLGVCVDKCDGYIWSLAGSQDGKAISFGTLNTSLGIGLASSTDAVTYAFHGHSPANILDKVAVQTNGSRNIGYSINSIPGLGGSLAATELTGATGDIHATLPLEATGHAGGSLQILSEFVRVRGHWVIFRTNFALSVMDARTLGPPGSITAGMPAYEPDLIPVISADELIKDFDAVVDPLDPDRLYIIVSLVNSNTSRLVFRVLQYEAGQYTEIGNGFQPSGDYGDATSMVFYPVGAIAVGTDVAFLMWSAIATDKMRLYSNSLSHWSAPPEADTFSVEDIKAVVQMTLASGPGSKVYAYYVNGDSAFAIPMLCDNVPHQRPDAGVPDDASVPQDFDGSLPPDASEQPNDAGCTNGAPCVSADGCQTGRMTCYGIPLCGSLVNKADGTKCGAAGTCKAGVCAVCKSGAACESPDRCSTGVQSCVGGQATCGALTPKDDGASCGNNHVCYLTACVPCAAKAVCTSVDGCQLGKLACDTGQPVCDGLAKQSDGTACPGGTCKAGVCSSCVTGAACSSDNGCQAGTVSCAGGAVCKNLKDKPDGTVCRGGVCQAGACVACTASDPCQSDDGCMAGTLECHNGNPVCSNLGPLPDKTHCPGGACRDGVCEILARDGGLVSRTDAAIPLSDGAIPLAGDIGAADVGAIYIAPSNGCGCQSGLGGAWSVLVLATGALALRRRRR